MATRTVTMRRHTALDTSLATQDRRQSMRRVIIKQGYLKKLPNQAKVAAALKKPERRWFVFGVIGMGNATDPYLEYYENEDKLFGHQPLNMVMLNTCRYLIRNDANSRYTNVFTLVLQDRHLQLVAQTRDMMLEWCRAIETKLEALGILHLGDNDYVTPPWSLPRPPRRSESRDPASPLPDVPVSPVTLTPPPTETVHGTIGAVTLNRSALPSYTDINFSRTVNNDNSDTSSDSDSSDSEDAETIENLRIVIRSKAQHHPADTNAISSNQSENLPAASGDPISSSQSEDQASGGLNNINQSDAQPEGQPTYSNQSGVAVMADLIDLDQELDEDVYEPMWDRRAELAAAAQNTQELYSVPRPRPRPATEGTQSTAAAAAGTSPPPVLPPKHTRRPASAVDVAPAAAAAAASPVDPPTLPPPRTPARAAQPPAAQQLTPLRMPQPPPFSSAAAGGLPPAGLPPSYTPRATNTPTQPFTGCEASHPGVDLSSPFPMESGALSPKMREALGMDAPQQHNGSVHGWNSPPPSTADAPPPYAPRGALERGANKSLKFSQVEQLEREMRTSGGIRVMLRRSDCHLTMALVDAAGKVWIAGWNQQARPFLHTAFHIGDQLVSVHGQVVDSARTAYRLIKHCSDADKISFIIRRVPNGRVFALKRERDGQALGLTRDGGTAEIVSVDPAGLAAQHGVPSKAPTVAGDNLCNWWITEINSRPLNLFFKDNEIEPRLNAVGRDISILLQPADFIKELKKQLKAMKKLPYKDFLLS